MIVPDDSMTPFFTDVKVEQLKLPSVDKAGKMSIIREEEDVNASRSLSSNPFSKNKTSYLNISDDFM